ncbi:hypothetical protein BGZ49_005555 [Haplosporangium sp. Z 27]|nr:hypothetical protein BGZ49_005555 [Haplosporangium sp. Z 27]
MLESLMVYSNNNANFFTMPLMDDSVAKLINTDSLGSYMQPTATSPSQEPLIPQSFYPQQQNQNQRQYQLQMSGTNMVSQSTPPSPQYSVKTEDSQQANVDMYLFPSTFDSQDHRIIPSQHSPQQRMLHFPNEVTHIMQQHQQHQQQQQKHEQQLRLQHQQLQQQQQIMYEATTAATSSMVSAVSSTSHYVPSTIATSAPFFQPCISDDSYNRQNTYTVAAHPAAPKRKMIEERQRSPQLTIDAASGVTTNNNNLIISDESSVLMPYAPSSTTTITSSRFSTSSRLDKVKPSRSTKITKASISSTEMNTTTRVTKKTTKKTIDSRESSEQPDNGSESTGRSSTGNITHPRRAAQNRAAQRTFRNRRKAYIKELEQKVQNIDRDRELMQSIHKENQEVRRRLQILENLANQSGVQLPAFPPLTPFSAIEFLNGSNVNGTTMMNMGSSNDEDEDDEELSDCLPSHQQMQ